MRLTRVYQDGLVQVDAVQDAVNEVECDCRPQQQAEPRLSTLELFDFSLTFASGVCIPNLEPLVEEPLPLGEEYAHRNVIEYEENGDSLPNNHGKRLHI